MANEFVTPEEELAVVKLNLLKFQDMFKAAVIQSDLVLFKPSRHSVFVELSAELYKEITGEDPS